MLRTAGRELVGRGRFRVWSIDVDGSTISAHLTVAAGREVAYWLGGIDDSRSKQSPGLISLLCAVEDALRRGESQFDLGSGGQDYKRRLADGEDHHLWLALVPPGPGYALTRARLRLVQLRYAATARLSDTAKARLRRLAGLVRRRRG
jgi:CelD/BcsL family acetyltransferase involved in cellulose biosynthesis